MTNPPEGHKTRRDIPLSFCARLGACWRLPGWLSAWLTDSFRCRPIGSICSAWLLAPSDVAGGVRSAASREQRLGNRVLTNVVSVLCVERSHSVECVCVCVITYHILRPTRPIREALIVCAREY